MTQETPLLDATVEKTYTVYKYRFLISFLYLLSAVTSSVMWVCTSPILNPLAKIYNIELFWVTLGASTIYLIIFIPMSFAANYIIDEKGLRIGIVVGNILTIIGLWIRTFSDQGFIYVSLGLVIASIGAPCILNTPQKISAVWYPPSQRALSTTILAIGAPIGVGIGFFMVQFFVDDKADGDVGLKQINNLMWFLAKVGTAAMVPAIILLREKPPTPPSKGAELEKYSYSESIKALVANKNYMIFLVATGFLWGTYGTLATVMQPLIEPFGYTPSDTGYYGMINLVMGLLGSPIWGAYVGRTKAYKKSLLFLSCTSTSLLTSLIFIGPLGNFYYTAIGIACYGFVTTPMLPIIFEYCCELTFPVAEANAGGITYAITQAVAVLGSSTLSVFLGHKTLSGAYIGFSLLIVFQTLGVIGYFATKEDLKRSKYEMGSVINNVDTSRAL